MPFSSIAKGLILVSRSARAFGSTWALLAFRYSIAAVAPPGFPAIFIATPVLVSLRRNDPKVIELGKRAERHQARKAKDAAAEVTTTPRSTSTRDVDDLDSTVGADGTHEDDAVVVLDQRRLPFAQRPALLAAVETADGGRVVHRSGPLAAREQSRQPAVPLR